MSSCNKVDKSSLTKEQKIKLEQPVTSTTEERKYYPVNYNELLKDFMTWYTYTYHNVKLSRDFVGLGADSSIIKKADFLKHLTTGKFIAVKIMAQNDVEYYKLHKLSEPNLQIEETVKQMALAEIAHFEMEGKEMPDYNFTDINGVRYDKNNTKEKIIVLKCWFIGCVACVKEFPELNKLVDTYKDRSDILFLSLAIDNKQKLINFLKKKEFNYRVVPSEEEYMTRQLRVEQYPTHILIDKDGKIAKVTTTIDGLMPYIEKLAAKASL